MATCNKRDRDFQDLVEHFWNNWKKRASPDKGLDLSHQRDLKIQKQTEGPSKDQLLVQSRWKLSGHRRRDQGEKAEGDDGEVAEVPALHHNRRLDQHVREDVGNVGLGETVEEQVEVPVEELLVVLAHHRQVK